MLKLKTIGPLDINHQIVKMLKPSSCQSRRIADTGKPLTKVDQHEAVVVTPAAILVRNYE